MVKRDITELENRQTVTLGWACKVEENTKLIVILVRKDISWGKWSKSVKPEGVGLKRTQNCPPRPWTHLQSEINRPVVPQILIRYIKDRLKDILLLLVAGGHLGIICPNESAGPNCTSVLIKVYLYLWKTNSRRIRRGAGLFGGTAYCFRANVLESRKITPILYIKENEHSSPPIILISNYWRLPTT